MINIYNWYISPNSELINGDVLTHDGTYTFQQEKISNIKVHGDNYIINDKYFLAKNNIDNFFKESCKIKIQLEFIQKKL